MGLCLSDRKGRNLSRIAVAKKRASGRIRHGSCFIGFVRRGGARCLSWAGGEDNGPVEVDEAFIGPNPTKMHRARRGLCAQLTLLSSLIILMPMSPSRYFASTTVLLKTIL
jgi:hypothetical protein